MNLELVGAGAFGALIGWYVYYINRYRAGDVTFNDLVSVIGIIGGGTVLALFDAGTAEFGAYSMGLFAGFFAYFVTLLILVFVSPSFTMEWFLDGRRKDPETGWGYGKGAAGTVRPMTDVPGVPQVVVVPQAGQGMGQQGAPTVVVTPR